jgi:hypothetical protein
MKFKKIFLKSTTQWQTVGNNNPSDFNNGKIGIFKIIAIIIFFLYLGTIDIIAKNRIEKNIQTSQNHFLSNIK